MIIIPSGEFFYSGHFYVHPELQHQDIPKEIIDSDDQWDADGHLWQLVTLKRSIHQYPFGLSIRFRNSVLHSIDYFVAPPELGLSWEDWSQEKEIVRKSIHDKLIGEAVGAERTFYWGSIYSEFDSKSGCAIVTIKYNTAEQRAAANP
jgi:hypothetical protein